jgi:hypothetical protein
MTFSNDQQIADHTGNRKKHPAASSSGSTISSYIYHSVAVGSGGYASPLSITSAGRINPTDQAYGAVGLVLTAVNVVGTITNSGDIEGGYGGYTTDGSAGGLAVDLSSAFIFTNKGIIAGGDGGNGEYTGGQGGDGVYTGASGTFINFGQIDAGFGGYGRTTSGAGGYGVELGGSATLSNSGTIRGGDGRGGPDDANGAKGGYAVLADREDLVRNTGVLLGGNGGDGYFSGGYGGIGAVFEYGSLNNSGTILGGSGGVSRSTSNENYGPGGTGGVGVYMLNASTGSNTGMIRGGNGNYGYFRGGYGGAGLYLQTYGSIANSGTITGGAGSSAKFRAGNGGAGLELTTYSTASNTGIINGGNGGAANADYGRGGNGGVGVFISQSSFTNTGKINGGSGGSTPGFPNGSYNIPGGDGLDAYSAVITNSGIITGGAGGSGFADGGTAGSGGSGVLLTYSTLTNTGTIIGGVGGHVPQSQYNNGVGGLGGAGAVVGAGSTLVNDKLIKGGSGGYDVTVGNTGGNGVIIAGGVFTNAGTVTQGYGGSGQRNGPNGDAVFFAGAGTLVAAPGAKFVGSVLSTLTSGSVLELTGSSPTALTGIGSQFIGINLISFATGATRTVEGNLGGAPQSGSYGAVIAGFAAHDTLVLDGFAASPNSTYIQTRFNRIDFTASGGKYDVVDYSNLLAKDLEVTAGSGKTTLTALGTTSTTLASGAAEFVRSGGTATGRISKGATEEILTGGTVTATTIAGGDLDLLIGAKIAGTIAFSGTGGILDIVSATLPTGTIASFVSGDTIELSGIAYNASDKVTVGTAGTVTITAPGISYKLDIANATKGETSFKFSAGSLLTTTAAAKPAMAFLAPETAAAAQAGSWAPDMANPFTLTAFPELPAETSQGLTLFAHYEPVLSYGMGQSACERSDPAGGLETAVIRHAGTSPW